MLNTWITITNIWNFLIFDKKLVDRYNEIWNKISNLWKTGFDSESVYND